MNTTLNQPTVISSANEPQWLLDRRTSGSQNYSNLPVPAAKDENWRFASVLSQDIHAFKPAPMPNDDAIQHALSHSTLVEDPIAEFIFVDDHLVQSKPLSKELADKGVCFVSIDEAIQKHSDLLEPHFLKESTRLGSQKYFGLHASAVKAGALLYVPKGVEIDKPIAVYHWSNQDKGLICPHTLIIAEAQTKVSLIDVLASTTEENQGCNISVSNIEAHPSANVYRKVIQNFNSSTLSFQLDSATADRDTQLENIAINLGAAKARYENQIKINGSGAHVTMYSLSVAEGTQEFDQRTLQTHNAPNSVSDLLYKNALFDTSRTIFSGLIQVEEGAQQTDAYQTNRNLLLDQRADANALPGLEILANDVKCSHGATTGNIDNDELFYMLSRGIPHRVAMQLIVLGFFEEIIEKLGSDSLAENIRKLLEQKFASKIKP
jgi:Fe-S cluster assembly protein SufD